MKGTRTCAAVTCLAVLLVYSNSPILAQENTSSKKATLANHEPSAGSNAAQDFMKAQAPLLSAAERIQSLDSQGTGLGGIRLKVDKHLLEVWWKGEPPSAVRKEIAQLEKSKDIKISLGSSQYTRKELLETARTIVSRANEYPGLVSLGPLPDGSGLEVGHPDTERAATFRFPVPVHIVMRKGAVPLFSRGHDTPPWWAGAVTRSAVQNPTTCSTGFAMARGANHGILTAEHCFCGGGVLFNNGVGVTIGLAEPASLQAIGRTDSLYIELRSRNL